MMKDKVNLLGMSRDELKSLAESLGERGYRGGQIADWLYKHSVHDIDEMPNLPAPFRTKLREAAVLARAKVARESKSSDGTAKYLLEYPDGKSIEAVFLPYEDRASVCVSTQLGCPAACTFCATGMGGFARHLTAGEIVDEVLTLQELGGRRVSHVVYMGMGEPLFNYDNVIKSIHLLNTEVGIAMRHITLSTVGITPMIDRLAEENLQITLAISLHAPNDALRSQLIPISTKYPLRELIAACRRYADSTHRRITFEYLLISEVNDTPELAKQLAALMRGMLASVNLIPYNAVEGLEYRRPPQARVKAFRAVLEDAGIAVTQRMERGESISAACGQLKRKKE